MEHSEGWRQRSVSSSRVPVECRNCPAVRFPSILWTSVSAMCFACWADTKPAHCKHAKSWAVWGSRQRLHDCGPRFTVRVGRGTWWPHREACDKLKHNATSVPVHAGPHAWGAPKFLCTAWWPNQGLLPTCSTMYIWLSSYSWTEFKSRIYISV